MSKYNNTKTERDGYKWDSLKELAYYQDLKLRKRAKDIVDFEVKPKEVLLEKQTLANGDKLSAMTYTPDFIVWHDNGTLEFVDVKGMITATFRLKWKLLQYKYRNEPKVKYTIA